MKLLQKLLEILLGILFIPPLLYLVLVIIGGVIPVNKAPDAINPYTTIHLVSNGMHTDIVMPLKTETIDWTKIVNPDHSLSAPTNAKYVSFGWGDLEFYQNTPQWRDLKLPTAFRALFLKTPSAIHVRFLNILPEGDNTRTVIVDETQYKKLTSYITHSFKFNTTGNTIPVQDLHYTRDDVFYKARGSLHLFKTCNTWVNTGLKASGLKACLWTPFVEGIFLRYPQNKNFPAAAGWKFLNFVTQPPS